jgi:aminoglycoside phosphotransferase (APT) family kinase protein
VTVSRTPAYLAALASTSVPGLDPVSVQAVRPDRGSRFDVGFVVDGQQRKWTVRVPRTAADGARQDATVSLLGLLARRLPFSIPGPKGFTAIAEGRAMVYPHLTGRSLDLAHLPAGPGLAAEIGRAIAALHNVDRRVYDEAAVPAYDAETYRSRHLAVLDRAATTGHVPAGLLERWEGALEDVTLWRFAPVPVHGRVDGRALIVVFDSEDDATTGHVRALTGWEHAKVADPADDLAAVVGEAQPPAAESVLEAYANSRIERPDPHLRRRAVLVSELRLLDDLLTAATGGEGALVREFAAALRDLDERTKGDDRLAAPPPGDPAGAFVPSATDVEAAGDDHGFGDVLAFGASEAGPPDGEVADSDALDRSTQEIPEHQLAKAKGVLDDPAPESGGDEQETFDEIVGELAAVRETEDAVAGEQVEEASGRERA